MITPKRRLLWRVAAVGASGAAVAALVCTPGTATGTGWASGPVVRYDPTAPDGGTEPTTPPATESPTDTPTQPTEPPATTTTAPPAAAPTLAVDVTAPDVRFGTGYWSGARTAGLRLSVHNGAAVGEVADVVYTLPAGVSGVGGGCGEVGNRQVRCRTGTIAPGGSWSLTVPLTATADAWRGAPLSGGVSVSATAPGAPQAAPASAGDQFAVLFPPGPPAAGLTLTARDVRLPAGDHPTGELRVRIGNTGTADAEAAVEVATPMGVQVEAFPAQCRSHQHVQARRERCVLGSLSAGAAPELVFTLAVVGAVPVDHPMWGAAQGFLTPAGRDQATTRTSFQIVVGGQPDASASAGTATPVPSASPTAVAGRPRSGGHAGPLPAPAALANGQISIVLVVSGIVGLVLVLGLGLLVSLRRRMRDDPSAPAEDAATG